MPLSFRSVCTVHLLTKELSASGVIVVPIELLIFGKLSFPICMVVLLQSVILLTLQLNTMAGTNIIILV